jgi:V/A-type H+-transporting ATPase subunit I
MSSADLRPRRMARVAVVAPTTRRRAVLAHVADAGVMEVDQLHPEATARPRVDDLLRDAPGDVDPELVVEEPDVDQLHEDRAWSLLAGEADLEHHLAMTVEHDPATIALGWVPEDEVPGFAARLARHGASAVELPRPPASGPPTRLSTTPLRRSLQPLVQTYAVVPYEDVDPTMFAAVTYVVMFGMMFGDVGHGLVLALLGLLLARSSHPRLVAVRRLWPFPVAAGLVAAVFGLLYGEAFGPTGLVPTLWVSPLDDPVLLLLVAIGIGAALIALSYLIGTVNRWREGGPRVALYAATGLAGTALFLGAAMAAGALAWQVPALRTAGLVLAASGLVLTFVGFRSEAGSGAAALGQAVIELFDTVVRAFANVVSFGRLAAFGLTHAAIGLVVWEGARSLWGPGVGAAAAIAVFVVGNVVAFALEGLVVGVQALRLEYYELFSRIFSGAGRLFEPWHVPIASEDVP